MARKHFKRPNGYGAVYKASGHRVRPYRAMVTVDRVIEDGKAKQVRKTIGYYATREEAEAACLQYHAERYDIDSTKLTFAEVYDRWSQEHFPTLVHKSQNSLQAAYKHCSGLHAMRMGDIRTGHLEAVIRGVQAGVATKKKCAQLISMMYDWAMAHDIIQKDYSALANYRLGEGEPVIQRVLFTPSEIQGMWENRDQLNDMILFSIYTGVRPTELVTIRTEDVDLEQRIITGGIKTDAGKDRVIPIHPDILQLVTQYVRCGHTTLFSSVRGNGRPYPYHTYRQKLTDRYPWHTCYDTRHTFSTAWKKQELNEHILKLIMGHKDSDVTEKFYTHRDIENLRNEMDRLVLGAI